MRIKTKIAGFINLLVFQYKIYLLVFETLYRSRDQAVLGFGGFSLTSMNPGITNLFTKTVLLSMYPSNRKDPVGVLDTS